MKKLFFVPVTAALFFSFSSCKKDKSSGPALGTVTASIDGAQVSFSSASIVIINGNDLQITGASSTSADINISVTGSGSSITTGIYTDTSSTGNSASITYTPSSNSSYTDEGTTESNVKVVITSISATSVQGTFSGVLKSFIGSGNPATHTITNGNFNLKISSL